MSEDNPFDSFIAPTSTDEPTLDSFVAEDDPFASVSPAVPAPVDEQTPPEPTLDGHHEDDDGFTAEQLEIKQESSEISPLALWEAERSKVLAERAEAARLAKDNTKQASQEDVSKFYDEREAKLEKTKKANRADERQKKQELQSLMESGSPWEKVAKLVSLNPKAGDKHGVSRVDRMRKLLIQLKTERKENL